MRPVARIAQSVEQGIENPRVLGSIPSPGTTIPKDPPKRRVFAFGEPDSPSNYVRLFAAGGLEPLSIPLTESVIQRRQRILAGLCIFIFQIFCDIEGGDQ